MYVHLFIYELHIAKQSEAHFLIILKVILSYVNNLRWLFFTLPNIVFVNNS